MSLNLEHAYKLFFNDSSQCNFEVGVFGNNLGFLANEHSVRWMSEEEMVDRMLQRIMC